MRVTYGARRFFLCVQFCEDKMRRETEQRPIQARRGGMPGVQADIRAYLNLIFDRGIPAQLCRELMYDGMPLWAYIYYLFRAGYYMEALKLLGAVIATRTPSCNCSASM